MLLLGTACSATLLPYSQGQVRQWKTHSDPQLPIQRGKLLGRVRESRSPAVAVPTPISHTKQVARSLGTEWLDKEKPYCVRQDDCISPQTLDFEPNIGAGAKGLPYYDLKGARKSRRAAYILSNRECERNTFPEISWRFGSTVTFLSLFAAV